MRIQQRARAACKKEDLAFLRQVSFRCPFGLPVPGHVPGIIIVFDGRNKGFVLFSGEPLFR